MKLKLRAIAVAAMLASGASWADKKAAEKWVNDEFQPSTLSKKLPFPLLHLAQVALAANGFFSPTLKPPA